MDTSLTPLLRAAHQAEHHFVAIVKESLDSPGEPVLQERLKDHLVEMQWQIRLLEACLEFRDGHAAAPCPATCRAAAESGAGGLIAIKRFKINLYKKILQEARQQQAAEVLQAGREIIGQERAMAEWLEDYNGQAGTA